MVGADLAPHYKAQSEDRTADGASQGDLSKLTVNL